MARIERQILVNRHSSNEKYPAGDLYLGEIAVQHNNVEDAALYVETVADSESASTVAKFITDKAIDKLIASAKTELETRIDSINDEIGIPHDPEPWNSGLTVWQAIEQTYEEMTAGTAAASTKLFIDDRGGHNEEYLKLDSTIDQTSSAVNYYIKTEGISEAIESAYTIVNDKVEALSGVVEAFSAATEDILDNLDFDGVPQEGKPIVNVTQEDGLVNAETGNISSEFVEVDESGTTLDEALEYLYENIEANKVESEDGSIVVTPGTPGTDEATTVRVNRDDATIVLNDNNELVADLKLSAVTPSSVNVREEFALIDHNGRQLGDTVKVYKDSSLYHAELGTMGDELASEDDPTIVPGTGDTALDLVYHKEDGTYELVKIDVNDFLEESEFQDGLEVDNHIVKVKIDANSEELVIGDSGLTAPVLTVGEDGIKVDNIQNAINYAVEELAGNIDADVNGTSQDGHVTVEVVQENTALANVIVTTDDIASEEELDTVEESVGLESDGSFTPDEATNYLSAATSVRNEIKLIDEVVKEISDKLNGTSVDKGTSVENFVKLDVTNDGEGATAITIDDSDLSEAIDSISSAITTERIEREAADAELLGSTASTSAETSIMGLKELITQIEEKLNGNAVQAAEFAVLPDDRNTTHCNAGIKVVENGENGQKVQLDLSLLKIDCGEY